MSFQISDHTIKKRFSMCIVRAVLVMLVVTVGGAAQAKGEVFAGFDRATFDLGASFGSYNNHNYTEVELGLNLFFEKYFAWRNAIFGRFPQGQDNIFGLDESVRVIGSLGNRELGFTAFAGPGYRFADRGDSAPFAEGGAVLRLTGFAIGVGAKSILNSWVHTNAPNDTQIFLILAGGGSL